MNLISGIKTHYIQPIRAFSRSAKLLLWMTIVNGIILSGWQLFFNIYMLRSGVTRDFLGLVNSMPSAAGLLFGIFMGRISDRIGRKTSMLIGILMSSIFLFMQVTFHQPFIIAAAAFLGGIFTMLLIVSQAPLMVKLSNTENRTLLFSLNNGLQTLAGAVGNLFAGQLPALFGSWLHIAPDHATAYQAVLVVSILLGTVSMIPVWMMEEPKTPQAGTSNREHPTKLSSTLKTLVAKMTLPQLLIGFGAAILIPYMNVFYKERFSISDEMLGALFSMSALFIGIGNLLAPRISWKLGGKIYAIVVTELLSIGFLLMVGFIPNMWLSGFSLLFRSSLMNMAAPLYSAFCMEHTPEHQQGFVNSILNLSWNAGWAVGPYISGIVQEHYGFSPLFITTAVLYLAAVALTWNFFIREKVSLPDS